MREPENCNTTYVGYSSPRTKEELEFEIMGLKNLIDKANEKISRLKQTMYIVEKAKEMGAENLNDLFTDKKWITIS